jgi:hypothetical protein
MQEVDILVNSIPFSRSSEAFFLSADWHSSGYRASAGFADPSFRGSEIWKVKRRKRRKVRNLSYHSFFSTARLKSRKFPLCKSLRKSTNVRSSKRVRQISLGRPRQARIVERVRRLTSHIACLIGLSGSSHAVT